MEQAEPVGFELQLGGGMPANDCFALLLIDSDLVNLDAIFEDRDLVAGIAVKLIALE